MERKPYTPKDPDLVSRQMKRIKGKDTGIELLLRKSLYAKGYRYRCNDRKIYGHPDIYFPALRIAVFADSEFWHGYNFEEAKKHIKIHENYWIPKIERNIERDKEVNEYLEEHGYTVLRYWGFEINKEPERVIKEIEEEILRKKRILELREKIKERTTLVYLKKGDSYLLLYRNKKHHDPNQGKYIGVGGHIKENESILGCAKREVLEETGLTIDKAKYLGYIDFLNEKFPAERMYLYVSDCFHGKIRECDEGELRWMKLDEIPEANLWEGDRLFLPLLNKDKGTFRLYLYYDGDALLDHVGPIWKEKGDGRGKR